MIRAFASQLYAILDAESCARNELDAIEVARAWCDAGICLMQYRDKIGTDDEVLRVAETVAGVFRGVDATLLLNDRVHLLKRSGWHGVHVGQDDMPVSVVRRLIGADAVLGVSTHSTQQVREASLLDVDYVAIGPVYATATKLNAEPVVGLEGVRIARSLTTKPLVAIGGIELENVAAVRAAGVDAVALISALLPAGVDGANGLRRTAQDFLLALQ